MSFAGATNRCRLGAIVAAVLLSGCGPANESTPRSEPKTSGPAQRGSAHVLADGGADGPADGSVGVPADGSVGVRVDGGGALERGVRWLVGRQREDGSWRSAKYGQMGCGVGNTALAVYGLAQTQDPAGRAAAERGVRFLVANLADDGYVRGTDGDSDYPTYATALLLSAIPKLSSEVPPATIGRMQTYLREAQQNARQGWQPHDRAFGGWSQTGGDETELKALDGPSISATWAALEGLEAGGALTAETREAALVYLARCQNWSEIGDSGDGVSGDGVSGDGGFFFTPNVTDPRNKAGAEEGKRARSYGTTTADGLCALVVCGVPESSPRRKAAAAWLRERWSADHVPGFPRTAEREALAAGLYYYHAAGLANCLRRAPEPDSAERRAALVRAIVARQQADGSWRNASKLMYEDDPLIATALAVGALGRMKE